MNGCINNDSKIYNKCPNKCFKVEAAGIESSTVVICLFKTNSFNICIGHRKKNESIITKILFQFPLFIWFLVARTRRNNEQQKK